MSENFGDRSECSDGNRRIDLQAIENFNQVLVSMDGDAMLFGDGDDLGGDGPTSLGQNPRKIVTSTLIAKRNSGRWILGHGSILFGFEDDLCASPLLHTVVTLRNG